MNLRDLEYLVAVADRRSFRQAAAACAVWLQANQPCSTTAPGWSARARSSEPAGVGPNPDDSYGRSAARLHAHAQVNASRVLRD